MREQQFWRKCEYYLLVFFSLGIVGCSLPFAREPLPDAHRRETPLSFGLYVTPDPVENPIDPPERFTGYHTGVDFEILPGEEDKDVPVFAICDGEVAVSTTAEGYGGVLVQHCTLDGEVVTVLYGHLDPASLSLLGTALKQGDQIGLLAPAKSAQSGFNRKHLHLAVHRGEVTELLGYVQDPKELGAFINPMAVLR